MVRYVYPPFQAARPALAASAAGHIRTGNADRILDLRIGIHRPEDFDGAGIECRYQLSSLPDRFRNAAARGVTSNRVGDRIGNHAGPTLSGVTLALRPDRCRSGSVAWQQRTARPV